MVSGAFLVLDVLTQIWVRLATWYPPNHFGNKPAAEFFEDYIAHRSAYNAALGEPDGVGTAGREAGLIALGDTMLDADESVVEMVEWLTQWRIDEFDIEGWKARWEAAKKHPDD